MIQTLPPHPLSSLYHFYSLHALHNVSWILSGAQVLCLESYCSWGSSSSFPPCAQDNRSRCLPRSSPTSDIGIAAFSPAYGASYSRANDGTYMLVSALSTASRSLIRQKPISPTAVFEPKALPACRGFPQPDLDGRRDWITLQPVQVSTPQTLQSPR
jgi:hypothetical protein